MRLPGRPLRALLGRMPMLRAAAAALLLAACAAPAPDAVEATAPAASAEPGPVARGRALAQSVCSRCHAVARSGSSPVPVAPRFRDLHQRYPVNSLEESLAEGIVVGHPLMPQFELSPGQIADLVAYLRSLEPGRGAVPG